jgi:hypothetical protein
MRAVSNLAAAVDDEKHAAPEQPVMDKEVK